MQRRWRISWPSVSSVVSSLDVNVAQQIEELLNEYALALQDEASKHGVSPLTFWLFRPFNFIGGVSSRQILAAFGPASGIPSIEWNDWRGAAPALLAPDLAVMIRERLGWEQFDVLAFQTDLLGQSSSAREGRLRELARERVERVVLEQENQARIVRMNPIFEGREFMVEDDLCFVLMPFREPFFRIYDEHIKPTIEEAGLRVMKADDMFTPTAIVEDIWGCINRARFLVADVTGRNANVYYELGVAHTVGKEVIILTQIEEDVPFDLRHLRYFTYTDNEPGWKALRRTLTKAIQAIVGP